MIYIQSFLFNVCFFVMMVIISFSAVIAGYINGYRGINKVGEITSRTTEFLLKWIMGTTTEFRDQHLVPKDGRYIVACKHQSTWETISLHRFVPDPTVIMKADLARIPVFGSVVKNAESILIDRKQGKQAPLMIEGARKSFENGRPVFIFPEGTRSEAGEVGKYRSGIFRMYNELQVPVLPIALNSGYFWPRRKFLKRKGHIVVQFLPIIEPGLSETEFMTTLKTRIESACEHLSPEAMAKAHFDKNPNEHVKEGIHDK